MYVAGPNLGEKKYLAYDDGHIKITYWIFYYLEWLIEHYKVAYYFFGGATLGVVLSEDQIIMFQLSSHVHQ